MLVNMFQPNKTYYIVFLLSLILYPSIQLVFVMISGWYIFDGSFIIILFLVVGFIPALITASSSIKFRDKFLQNSASLNIIKIKWVSYTIIKGVIVSVLMPVIIAFCFNGLSEIRTVLVYAFFFAMSAFFCSLIACVILLCLDRYIKPKHN